MKLWNPLYKVEEADWLVLGIPFSAKTSAMKGCEKAPDAIRKHFDNFWTYDISRKKDLFDEKIVDLGNAKSRNYKDLEKEISSKMKEINKKNPRAKILFIGGDHSVTPLLTKSVDINSYLCLDAHFDLLDKYGKDKNSHACSNRRVYEQGIEMHLRGIRSASKEEFEFGEKEKIDWRKDIGFNGKIDYFSLDADVMDPVFMGTGNPEMFGFTPEQVIHTIRNTNFKYFDFIEWIPDAGYAYAVQIIKEVLMK